MQAMPLQWKLEDLLERHDVSAYRLAKESGVGLTTIYRIKNNRTNTVQGQVLEAILQALLVLTGKRHGIGDLLEWQPEAGK